MLDARRAQQKGYITLKEAGKIANYSPDYVGQLIRAGKIRGEQVYSNVVWVTTEAEIREYVTRTKGKTEADGEAAIAQEVARYTAPILYAGIGCLSVLVLVALYILFAYIDNEIERSYTAQVQETPHAYNESS